MSTESLFLCTTWGNYGCYSPVFWSDLGTLPRGRVIQDVIPVDPTCATSCETFGTVSQFSCVSVGSEIFVIGGKHDTTRWDLDLDDDGLTNAVYSTNVAGRRSDFTWKKHSNLLLARNPMATLVSEHITQGRRR